MGNPLTFTPSRGERQGEGQALNFSPNSPNSIGEEVKNLLSIIGLIGCAFFIDFTFQRKLCGFVRPSHFSKWAKDFYGGRSLNGYPSNLWHLSISFFQFLIKSGNLFVLLFGDLLREIKAHGKYVLLCKKNFY